jgi:hypothetical protein
LKDKTTIENDTTGPMGMEAFTDVREFVEGVDFTDKTVYVIPYGGSVVPMVKDEKNPHA